MPLPAIETTFYELGPIPHLCFGTERSLIDHRVHLDVALQGLTSDYLDSLASRGRLSLDAVSSKIYVLRRVIVDVDSVGVFLEPISPFVASKVLARMRTLQPHELVHLFHRYMVLPFTRRMTSDVFEAYCHVTIELHFLPTSA